MIADYWGRNRIYHLTCSRKHDLRSATGCPPHSGGRTREVFQRHWEAHLALVEGLEDLGLKMLVDEPFRLPMLNTVCVPEGIDDGIVRGRLRNQLSIELGAGLGPFAGKAWRVGLMGHTARLENVSRFLAALKEALRG